MDQKIIVIRNYDCNVCKFRFPNIGWFSWHLLEAHRIKVEKLHPPEVKVEKSDFQKVKAETPDPLETTSENTKPKEVKVEKSETQNFITGFSFDGNHKNDRSQHAEETKDDENSDWDTLLNQVTNENLQILERKDTESKKLGCQVCYHEFDENERLAAHFRLFHKQFLKTRYCKLCKKLLKTEELFFEHITQSCLQDENRNILECKVCNVKCLKRGDNKDFQEQHTHTNTYEYKCKDCGEIFKSVRPINKHDNCETPKYTKNELLTMFKKFVK